MKATCTVVKNIPGTFMRALILVSLMSACAAQRLAVLFANRTVASVLRNKGIFPAGGPRRSFYPAIEDDKGFYWTSHEFMNCKQYTGCGGDPCCSDSKVLCQLPSYADRDPIVRDVLLGASEMDRYALIVHENTSDLGSWRCNITEDALQSVTVTAPDHEPLHGWQSVTLHAFVYYDKELDGVYFETRHNNVFRSKRTRLVDENDL